jgi:triacylglycerol lipase
MSAWLQRLLVLGVVTMAASWLAWCRSRGLAWPWSMLAIAVLLPHAPVLALEYVLLRRWGRDPAVAGPTVWQSTAAWAGEVISGVRVFAWRQPFAASREPDQTSMPGRRGVVLVHGFFCNRGLWTPWLRRLRQAGVPRIAVTLEPAFGSIDDYVPLIDDAVRRLHVETGCAPLIVAHSMGGLAARAWLRSAQDDDRMAGLITIGTPHRGTWLARFAFSRNGRQMRIGSPWLAALATAELPARRGRMTCFYGHADNVVFPATTATLPEARNIHLSGVAHVCMASRAEVFDEAMRQLGARPGPAGAA